MEFHELPAKMRSLESKIQHNVHTISLYEADQASDIQEIQTAKGRAYVDKTAMLDLIRSQNESLNNEYAELKEHQKVLSKVFAGLIK